MITIEDALRIALKAYGGIYAVAKKYIGKLLAEQQLIGRETNVFHFHGKVSHQFPHHLEIFVIRLYCNHFFIIDN